MAWEIERRFLLKNDGWRAQVRTREALRQAYLSAKVGPSGLGLRVRTGDGRAWLTLKGRAQGSKRREFEYEIPPEDAEILLTEHRVSGLIEKVRHRVPIGRHCFEIDVFEGDNAGLIIAEVELQDEHEQVELPDWIGEEITGDRRYANAALAREPWRVWGWREAHWRGEPEETAIWDPPPAQVIAALDACAPGDVIATDADGTLWRGDVGDDVMRWAIEQRGLNLDLAAYLALEHTDYAEGCFQSARVLAGLSDLDDGSRSALLGAWIAARVRPRAWLVEALKRAEDRGVIVVVVTAAPEAAVSRVVRALGLGWPVIGVRAEADGALIEPAPVDAGKPKALAARGYAPAQIALGDTRYDLPLLRSAAQAFWLKKP